MIRQLFQKIKAEWQTLDEYFRSKATDTLEWETAELEHIFTLLTFGYWVGFPAPPIGVSLDLMPVMEKEIIHMIQRVDLASAPLSELFSYLDID
ncbi:hypothetical protein DRI50_10165 [candidate division KSB1 bacterium]|jgi:hypothetical protein|nr:MAG: hypothetical protein DRI50_10165 [candidate division KSB1 bacterium]